MSWLTTLVQSCVLIALSYLAIQFFSVNSMGDIQSRQEDLRDHLAGIELHLQNLENQLKDISRQKIALGQEKFSATARHKESMVSTQRFKALQLKIDDLEQTINFLLEQERIRDEDNQLAKQHPVPKGWMADLSQEKKALVQTLFKERLAAMQDAVDNSNDGTPSTPDNLSSLLEDSQQELKSQLEDILSAEEFRSFLETLEKTQHPPDPPAVSPKQ